MTGDALRAGKAIMPDAGPAYTAGGRAAPRWHVRDGATVEDLGPLSLVVHLGRGRLGETWHARLEDGRDVAATLVRPGSVGARRRLLRNLATLQRVAAPELVPLLGVAPAGEPDALWAVAELDGGVPLRRLLRVTEPSPAQILAVLRSVLRALEALEEAGLAHLGLRAGDVHVGLQGDVRLDLPVATAAQATSERTRADLRAVNALLESLVARRPRTAGGAASAVALAARLQAFAERGTLAGCTSVAEARAVVDAEDAGAPAEQVATELAALVGAVRGAPAARPAHEESSAVVHVTATAVPRTLAAAPAPPRDGVVFPPLPGWSRRRSVGMPLRRPRSGIVVGVAAACAALLVVAAVALVLRGGRGHAVQTSAAPPATAAQATPHAVPPPVAKPAALTAVPQLGPASTATIRGITAPAVVGACTGSSTSCVVSARVVLAPHGAEPVAWDIDVVDRCTGAVSRQPGGGLRAVPQYQYVYGPSTISIPAGRPVAVIAVSSSPSVAASPPLLLGSSAC